MQELLEDGNLMEGLCELMDDNLDFTEKDAANLVRKILRGLSYIHSSGYVHRDIKLENIMITMKTNEKG